MTFDADHTHAEPRLDRLDPGTDAAQPDAAEAVDAEIAAWQARLRQVQEMRRLERPIKTTAGSLDDLEQLRGFAMGFAERLDREGRGMLRETEREAVGYNNRTDITLRFVRVARAVRQIVVLEQEMLGLRPVAGVRAAAAAVASSVGAAAEPDVAATDEADDERGDFERAGDERPDFERCDLRDRPDPDDLDDYDDRPAEQVIAALRRDLGAPVSFAGFAAALSGASPQRGEGRGEGAVKEVALSAGKEESPSPSFGIRPGCAGPSLCNPLPVGASGSLNGFGADHRERAPP